MKGRSIIYSSAELAWLKAKRTMTISDYHKAFCVKFDREDVSAANLHALRKRNGWRTGRTGCFEKGLTPHNKGKPMPYHPASARTQFKKGNLPHNVKYAGHERISKDGYVEISIEETNPHTGFERRYVLKHRWLWEKKHGPVPAGMCLKCKGDRMNADPSNWELVPRALLPRLNGGRNKTLLAYDEVPAALRPAIMTVAKIEHSIREKAKRSGRAALREEGE